MRNELFLLFAAAAFCGCSPSSDDVPSVANQAFRAELEGGRAFELHQGESLVNLRVRGQWIGEGESTTELPIISGRVELAPGEGDALRLVDLALSLEDVVISKSIYPPGARLSDVALELADEASAPASWSDSDAHSGGELDVDLSWSLHLGDSTAPLATQPIANLPYDVSARAVDGEVVFELSIVDEGSIWKLDDYLEVVGVDIQLAGTSAR